MMKLPSAMPMMTFWIGSGQQLIQGKEMYNWLQTSLHTSQIEL